MKSQPDYLRELEAAAAFLREHDRYLVVSHVNPDGDAASSTCAVGLILRQLGKTYHLINEGPIPVKFRYLEGATQIADHSAQPSADRYDAVVMVDCADYARAGQVRELFAEGAALLNIDHHPTNDRYGTVALVKDDAAATAEILYDLANALGLAWSRELAECIYTGLLTDTGGFRYSNTTPKVMEIASRLLEHGVNGPRLANALLEKMTMAQMLLLKAALATLSFSVDGKIGWVTVTKALMAETGAHNDDTEGLVNYPLNIEGVEVAVLLKQLEADSVKVSLRSSERADVSQIAAELGGGGHVRAAGCTVHGSLDEVLDKVLSRVRQAIV